MYGGAGQHGSVGDRKVKEGGGKCIIGAFAILYVWFLVPAGRQHERSKKKELKGPTQAQPLQGMNGRCVYHVTESYIVHVRENYVRNALQVIERRTEKEEIMHAMDKKIYNRHNGLEKININSQPQWLRKIHISHNRNILDK